MHRFFLLSLVTMIYIVLLVSCSKQPQAINYGKDACHYCQMTIVDKIHGAEIVTDKGKIFKFDAAECLINFKNELTESSDYQFLTNYFEEPSRFIQMNEANYLISEKLPSPMGASLTAFKTENALKKLQREKGGEAYNWEELNAYLSTIKTAK